MAKARKSPLGIEVGAAAIGMAIGGILGMLFAPKSGKQTRKALASKGRKLAATASRTVKKSEAVAVKALRSKSK